MAEDSPSDDTGSGYGGGGYGGFNPMLPMQAQAMHMDPRFALAQAIMQTGQQSLQQPTYTGWGALAKALTMGLGGASTAYLQDQYMGANANSADLDKHLAATLPEGHTTRNALLDSDPNVRAYARMAYPGALAQLNKTFAAQPASSILTAGTQGATPRAPMSKEGQQLADAISFRMGGNSPAADILNSGVAAGAQPGGIRYDVGGGASVVPGGAADPNYLQLKALATGRGEGQAGLEYKPATAGATAVAENPALINRAVGITAGNLPYEVARDRLKPDQVRENAESYFPPLPPNLQLPGGPPRIGFDMKLPAPPQASSSPVAGAGPAIAPPAVPGGPPAPPMPVVSTAPGQTPPVSAPTSPQAAGSSNLSITQQPGGGLSVRNDGTVRTTTENNEKLFNDYRDVAGANVGAEKNIRNAADAFQYFQGGKGTEMKAETAGWLKSVGIEPKTFTSTPPAQVEIAKKAVIQAIFSQMAGVKNPALAEFAMLEKSVAQPDFQPESAKAILANAMAKMHYQNDFAQEMGNYRQEHGTMRGYDSTPFLSNGLNLMNGYQTQAHDSLPQFMGEGGGSKPPVASRADYEAEIARRGLKVPGAP